MVVYLYRLFADRRSKMNSWLEIRCKRVRSRGSLLSGRIECPQLILIIIIVCTCFGLQIFRQWIYRAQTAGRLLSHRWISVLQFTAVRKTLFTVCRTHWFIAWFDTTSRWTTEILVTLSNFEEKVSCHFWNLAVARRSFGSRPLQTTRRLSCTVQIFRNMDESFLRKQGGRLYA